MHFVWQSDVTLYEDFMFVSRSPDGLNHGEWIRGERLATKPKAFTLVGDSKYASALSDMVLTQFQLPVLSPRAVETLHDLGIENIECFPVTIKRPKVTAAEKSYKIVNIVGLINCLDKSHAIFETFSANPNKLSSLRQYRILEDRIAETASGKKPPLIFRLGEFPYHALVHESVKEAFEQRQLTGAKFTPPEKLG
jgi:hypothetical protein